MVFIRMREIGFIEILNIIRVLQAKVFFQILVGVGRRPIVTSGNARDRYRTALVHIIFELAGKVQQMVEFPSIPRITHPETHLSRDLKLGVNCQPSYAQGSP